MATPGNSFSNYRSKSLICIISIRLEHVPAVGGGMLIVWMKINDFQNISSLSFIYRYRKLYFTYKGPETKVQKVIHLEDDQVI